MATTGNDLVLHGPRASKLFCKRGHHRTALTLELNSKVCRLCHAITSHPKDSNKRYYETHKDACNKRSHLNRLKQYGLTPILYNELFIKQNGKCLGCDIHQSDLNKTLHVDHDHKTGKVRGLLCRKCNSLLGLANDQIKILTRLIQYLSRNDIVQENA